MKHLHRILSSRAPRLLSACALLAVVPLWSGCRSAAPGPGASRFPDVELVTHADKKVHFYSDLLQGKIVVLNFMYTTCEGGCVPSTQNLTKVHELLGKRVGRDIFFYSISLDPENDKPAALREYMELYDVKPGWTFLTGRKEDVEKVRRSVGFVDIDPEVDAKKSEHAGLVLVGSEKMDRWIKCPALGQPDEIAEAILWMEPGNLDGPAGSKP